MASHLLSPAPSLPPEIVLKIMSYCAINSSFETFGEKAKNLNFYSLISTSFRYVAQSELFSHPVLQNRNQLFKYLEQVKIRGGEVELRTLRIDCSSGGNSKITILDLKKLFKYCGGGIEEIYLNGVDDLKWNDFMGLKRLESLHLYQCYFINYDSSFRLPNLRKLSILRSHSPTSGFKSSQLITSSTTPSLRHLAVDSIRLRYPDNQDSFITSLVNRMANQLESLMISCIDGNESIHWNQFQNLKLLTVDSAYSTHARLAPSIMSELLYSIPSKLECVMFPYNSSFREFSSRFRSIESLHTLIYTTNNVGINQINRDRLREIKQEAGIVSQLIKAKVQWNSLTLPDQDFHSSHWLLVTNLEKGKYTIVNQGDFLQNMMSISI